MFAHLWRYAPAQFGRHIADRFIRPAPLLALCCAAFLAGCTSAPPAPLAAAHPANPDAEVRRSAYQPVIGPYARQRPRDPSDWGESNERIAPQDKP